MWVNHVHLMPQAVREDATLDAFLRLADAVGIEGAVCFAPFSYQMEKLGLDSNVWLAEQLAGKDYLVGYGTLDPQRPAAEQVRHIAELGFRGIKLHPPAQRFSVSSDWAYQAYAQMQASNLIADFHLGVHWHRLKDYDVSLFDEIAWHFPKLRMVFEHVGGWHYYRQVLAIIINNQYRGNHLFAGIASVLDNREQRYWYLGAEGVEECRWQIGSDLLIFGLDFPYNGLEQVQRDLRVIRSLPWEKADIDKLLGANLRRLLNMETQDTVTIGEATATTDCA